MDRKCGVLLPITSLPSPHGIGCFSKEAYEFIDFLKASGQTYWQILPLGQTGYGDSPYQSFSTFAGNPYMIDLEKLIEAGYLTREEVTSCDMGQENPSYADYGKLYENRMPLLCRAYLNSPFCLQPQEKWKNAAADKERDAFSAFIQEESAWLPDYALYSAVKKHFKGVAFTKWDEPIRMRKPEAMEEYRKKLAEDIRYYEFLQYMFSVQWAALREYAHSKDVRLFGDLPIYVAMDSADTWSHPELFELDEKGFPLVVAGVPPDAFSETGQLWGNPIYRWDYHKDTDYAWWMQRIRYAFQLYDVVRIDHFRGFESYWVVPAESTDARIGEWRKGPGDDLFHVMKQTIGDEMIVAEDLGILTVAVRELLERTEYPGMKVLQFAFDADATQEYLPHNYTTNYVVYTGTHDNDTTRGWFDRLDSRRQSFVMNYAGVDNGIGVVWGLIRAAMMSVADTAIIPMQDYLNLGSEARINTPSTIGDNWKWRLAPGQLSQELSQSMRVLAQTFGRI